jgi:hypothetical protein
MPITAELELKHKPESVPAARDARRCEMSGAIAAVCTWLVHWVRCRGRWSGTARG